MYTRIRRDKIVIKTRGYPGLEVLPSPIGIQVRRPGYRQRVHTVIVFELMGDEAAIFAAAARHDHVILAVMFLVPLAQLYEFSLAFIPVHALPFVFRIVTGGTDAMLVE